jgi:hypothetical protein
LTQIDISCLEISRCKTRAETGFSVSNSEYEGHWTVPLLLLWSIFAVAQLKGRFYLEKDLFAKGEPVFLYFELTNGGLRAERVSRADPYSFCSGSRYEFRVIRGGGQCAQMAVLREAAFRPN